MRHQYRNSHFTSANTRHTTCGVVGIATEENPKMSVGQIMTQPPKEIRTTASVSLAATRMRDWNTGVLIVTDDGHLVGVITDHDIITRCIAENFSPQNSCVEDFMSDCVFTCRSAEAVETACAIMGDHHVRRLPVCNNEGELVGMLSLDAVAEHYSERLAGETLGEVVEAR